MNIFKCSKQLLSRTIDIPDELDDISTVFSAIFLDYLFYKEQNYFHYKEW